MWRYSIANVLITHTQISHGRLSNACGRADRKLSSARGRTR